MGQHYVICGLGWIGGRVLDFLRAAGAEVVVIDLSFAPDDPRLRGARLIQGDCRREEILLQADLHSARGVLILTSEDLSNVSCALTVRHLCRDVRIVLRMFNQNLMTHLGKVLRNVFALSAALPTAPLLALIARTGEALGTFRLEDGRRQQITEVTIQPGSPLMGRSVAGVSATHSALPIAHITSDGSRRFLRDVDPEARLDAGDRLVLCGHPRSLAPVVANAEQETMTLPALLWAGKFRRVGRMIARTWGEMDLAVKICTSVLMAVILVSTLVFVLGRQESGADALFRTISLIATGADMHGRDLEGWQKIFVSVLRLLGAALVAAFTAILTNYLLRAHLRGALEVRRIPDRGHIVVCGMGNVGFRVVEELLHEGEQVVAVEKKADNPFIPTARGMGAAVIVGDSTMPEVLRQANAKGARAVVATTDNELANLEIALMARDINLTGRVVVRLNDPKLAQMLREAANVRLAFSLPELAASAFVATLFGDRVRSVFFIVDQLLAVVDLAVQPGDVFLEEQTVRALAVDYHLLPIALQRADKTARPEPLESRLEAGDSLTVVVALADLQRLLKREKVPHDHAVEVTACPESARPAVARVAGAEEGQLERLPACVRTGLTRGQAEDLLCRLRREQATAHARQVDGVPVGSAH